MRADAPARCAPRGGRNRSSMGSDRIMGSIRLPAQWPRSVPMRRADRAERRSLDYRAPADRAASPPLPAAHAPAPSRRQERVPPQAAHDADDGRHRRRDHRVRPAAHDRRRVVRRRRTRARSARLVTRSAVSLVFSLPLTYAQKIRQVPGVRVGVVGQLVRRRLHHRAQFLSAVRDRRADAISTCIPEFVLSAGRAQGVPDRPQGRGRRPQARRAVRLEGRRPDSAARHDLSRAPGRSRCAASTTAPSKGTDQSTFFFHWDYLNETIKKLYPRRGDQTGVFIVAARAIPQQAAEVSRRSTRRSGTRSPRR